MSQQIQNQKKTIKSNQRGSNGHPQTNPPSSQSQNHPTPTIQSQVLKSQASFDPLRSSITIHRVNNVSITESSSSCKQSLDGNSQISQMKKGIDELKGNKYHRQSGDLKIDNKSSFIDSQNLQLFQQQSQQKIIGGTQISHQAAKEVKPQNNFKAPSKPNMVFVPPTNIQKQQADDMCFYQSNQTQIEGEEPDEDIEVANEFKASPRIREQKSQQDFIISQDGHQNQFPQSMLDDNLNLTLATSRSQNIIDIKTPGAKLNLIPNMRLQDMQSNDSQIFNQTTANTKTEKNYSQYDITKSPARGSQTQRSFSHIHKSAVKSKHQVKNSTNTNVNLPQTDTNKNQGGINSSYQQLQSQFDRAQNNGSELRSLNLYKILEITDKVVGKSQVQSLQQLDTQDKVIKTARYPLKQGSFNLTSKNKLKDQKQDLKRKDSQVQPINMTLNLNGTIDSITNKTSFLYQKSKHDANHQSPKDKSNLNYSGFLSDLSNPVKIYDNLHENDETFRGLNSSNMKSQAELYTIDYTNQNILNQQQSQQKDQQISNKSRSRNSNYKQNKTLTTMGEATNATNQHQQSSQLLPLMNTIDIQTAKALKEKSSQLNYTFSQDALHQAGRNLEKDTSKTKLNLLSPSRYKVEHQAIKTNRQNLQYQNEQFKKQIIQSQLQLKPQKAKANFANTSTTLKQKNSPKSQNNPETINNFNRLYQQQAKWIKLKNEYQPPDIYETEVAESCTFYPNLVKSPVRDQSRSKDRINLLNSTGAKRTHEQFMQDQFQMEQLKEERLRVLRENFINEQLLKMQQKSDISQKRARKYKSNDFGNDHDFSSNTLDFFQRTKMFEMRKEENRNKLDDKYYGSLGSRNASRTEIKGRKNLHNQSVDEIFSRLYSHSKIKARRNDSANSSQHQLKRSDSQVNPKSLEYICKNLYNDIDQVLKENMLTQTGYLNYDELMQALISLGYTKSLRESQAELVKVNQKSLENQLWQIMSDCNMLEMIPAHTVKIYLTAVEGIFFDWMVKPQSKETSDIPIQDVVYLRDQEHAGKIAKRFFQLLQNRRRFLDQQRLKILSQKRGSRCNRNNKNFVNHSQNFFSISNQKSYDQNHHHYQHQDSQNFDNRSYFKDHSVSTDQFHQLNQSVSSTIKHQRQFADDLINRGQVYQQNVELRKQKQIQEELDPCTFKPSINKNLQSSTTILSSKFQEESSAQGSQQQDQEQQQELFPDRFTKLYQENPLRLRSKDPRPPQDIEFESQKAECTFVPITNQNKGKILNLAHNKSQMSDGESSNVSKRLNDQIFHNKSSNHSNYKMFSPQRKNSSQMKGTIFSPKILHKSDLNSTQAPSQKQSIQQQQQPQAFNQTTLNLPKNLQQQEKANQITNMKQQKPNNTQSKIEEAKNITQIKKAQPSINASKTKPTQNQSQVMKSVNNNTSNKNDKISSVSQAPSKVQEINISQSGIKLVKQSGKNALKNPEKNKTINLKKQDPDQLQDLKPSQSSEKKSQNSPPFKIQDEAPSIQSPTKTKHKGDSRRPSEDNRSSNKPSETLKRVSIVNLNLGQTNEPQQNIPPPTMLNLPSQSQLLSPQIPLLFLDVNLGNDRMQRIIINEGDNIPFIVEQFCKKHNLNQKKRGKLQLAIETQLAGHLHCIQEED